MRRATIRLIIAILTFAVGVTVSMFWIAYRTPPIEKLNEPVANSCFPGASTKLDVMSSASMKRISPYDFCDKQEQNEVIVDLYTKHLAAMSEPALLSSKGKDESYRFLWMRTFHHPVIIRLERSGDKRILIVKELNGAGGYNPGKLIVNRIRSLTKSEWDEFARRVAQACFWRLPMEDGIEGNDGASWILEGYRQGCYHAVNRWSPADDDYRECCLYLLKISGLGIDEHSKELY